MASIVEFTQNPINVKWTSGLGLSLDGWSLFSEGLCIFNVSRAFSICRYQNLSIFIGPEPIKIYKNTAHGVPLATLDKVLECNAKWIFWFNHVKDFILEIEINVTIYNKCYYDHHAL